MTFGESAFQRYLTALHAEHERVVNENLELRKELQKDPLWHLRRSSEEVSPPVQPIVAYAATPSTSVPGEIHGDPLWQIRGEDCEIIEPVRAMHGQDSTEFGDYGNSKSEKGSGKSPPAGTPKRMSVSNYKRQNSRWIEDEESEDSPNFLLLLDVIPAMVIMLSAAVAGLSADIDPDHMVWQVFEVSFTVFFIGEILVKMWVFGPREYLVGRDWYWTWFDILCVVLALVDLTITYTTPAATEEGGSDAGTLSSLKMLKLARLGRIVRLLKFKIFQELKLMIQGVFTGLRVLSWAVVLLVGCMYLLGVITRTLFGADHEEFSSVPAAMFTSFRCFTDGCTAYDGTPLQEELRKKSGGFFMLTYILLFLFVTIGIFNLIMAVFIDNVTDGSTKKRQRQLGANAPKTEWVISSVLRNIILTKILAKEAEEESWGMDEMHGHGRRPSKILTEKLAALQEMYGYKPHTVHEYEKLTNQIRQEMARRDVVVTRDEFNQWLACEKDLISTLDDSEIDLSCKSDLFDVLDADLSGELEFEEMVDGLLKCRQAQNGFARPHDDAGL